LDESIRAGQMGLKKAYSGFFLASPDRSLSRNLEASVTSESLARAVTNTFRTSADGNWPSLNKDMRSYFWWRYA